jgi:transcriptional regulator with XRE-family HTH domain
VYGILMATKIFLHNLLRILKKKDNMSKADLSKLLDVHVGTVNNWFQRERMPESLLLEKIIEQLEIEPHELFIPIDSLIEIDPGKSELLHDVILDIGKIKHREDEILLSVVAEQLVPTAKAFTRFKVTNQGESSKLLIQSQKIRLLELAQKVSGVENISSSEEVPLAAKIKQLNEAQLFLIESAIDGLLLAEARKSSKKEVS